MHRPTRIARVSLLALIPVATLAAGCGSAMYPTSASLTTAASTYWTDLSLHTAGSLSAAYDYLESAERAHCPVTDWQRAGNSNRFSDVQVSETHVTSDDGSAMVTITYLVVGFMDRDPDLPTATFSTHWRWEGSTWHIESPVSCAACQIIPREHLGESGPCLTRSSTSPG